MRDLLAELHHRAWTATAVAGALAALCAAAQLALPAVLAAMAAGAILMWRSEEENRVVAAMALDVPSAPASAPILVPTAATPTPVPTRDATAAVREWASPFPASRSVRRQRPQPGRRARR
jgi:hypothetical protein